MNHPARRPTPARSTLLAALVIATAAASLVIAEAAEKKSPAKKQPAAAVTPRPTPKASPKPSPSATPKPSPKPRRSTPAPAASTPRGNPTPQVQAAPSPAPKSSPAPKPTPAPRAPSATVEVDAIAEFSAQPPAIQKLIRDAIDLTRLNLTYTFGSADPASGGMDCSGTIYYLLRGHGFPEVPRDSAGQYLWARKSGAFYPVVGKSPETEELDQLRPGDLMFWTGTYRTSRDIAISHVMLYLGREKKTGKRIMFGSSDGRSYNGVQRWGVSVFDFKMPLPEPSVASTSAVDFIGYARIPGLRDDSSPEGKREVIEPSKPAPESTSRPRAKASTKSRSEKSAE